MPNFIETLLGKPEPFHPLPAGIFSYHTPADAAQQYRLHLRVEPDGEGVLIVNASSILHLNQTATEIVWHLMQGHSTKETMAEIAKRYQVTNTVIEQDLKQFQDQLRAFIQKKDQEPVSSFGFEPHYDLENLSAPYRMDFGLTYRTQAGQDTGAELDTQTWKALIEKAYKAGVPHLVFFGGEPVLREDLVDLLKYTEELGLVSGLVSNSVKLHEAGYLAALLDAGLDHLMIPTDPAQTLDRESLKSILDQDLYTCVHFDVDDTQDYGLAVQELRDLGVNAFSFLPANPDMLPLSQDLAAFVEESSVALVSDLPLPYGHPSRASKPEPSAAYHSEEEFVYLEVNPQGEVLAKDGRELGNLVSEDFSAIWNRRQ